MEALVLMLQESLVPWVIGLAASFTLSKWSRWSARTKIRAAYVYQFIMVIGSFYEIPHPHGDFWDIQLRSGVFAAFGIGVSMSQWRFATRWVARLAAALFFLLHYALIWLRFSDELTKAFGHAFGL